MFKVPSELREGFCDMSLARLFMNPDVNAHMLPGVWVLSILTYFN